MFVLFSSSVLYSLLGHNYIPEKILLIQNGQLLKGAPLSPIEAPPLGTDNRGYSLAFMLLIGAKYTIGISMLIAGIRMLISGILGWIYGMYFYRFRQAITTLLDGMHYIPSTLLAFVILLPILKANLITERFNDTQSEREIMEIIILVLIVLPVSTLQVGNIIGEIKENEFILSAKVLGANSWQIFWNEILPHFVPRFSVICIQQLINVTLILAHLGILGLFFGGTIVNGQDLYSVSNEWSGLIGLYHAEYLKSNAWLFLAPITLFTITILAFNFMVEGIKNAIVYDDRRLINKRSESIKNNVETNENLSKNDFATDIRRASISK